MPHFNRAPVQEIRLRNSLCLLISIPASPWSAYTCGRTQRNSGRTIIPSRVLSSASVDKCLGIASHTDPAQQLRLYSVVVEVLVIVDRLPHEFLLETEKGVFGCSRKARKPRKPAAYVMSDNHQIQGRAA